MIGRATALSEAKHADLKRYSDETLQLYVADFVVRAYATALNRDLPFIEYSSQFAITEEVVDKTEASLPKDWPTDWWLKRHNSP
jgi:hypothetical protein